MSPLRISSLVACFFLHASVSAQTWQSLASQMSGTPAGVGPQPQGGSTWLAATGTGAYRSTDNGQTWTAANTGLLDPGNGITLAHFFMKTPTGRILRGGDNSSWNNRIGSPLWYSDDDGLTWSESLLPFGSPAPNPAGIGFTAFTVHGGAIFAADQLSQGVWKSTDDGLTWTAARNGIPTTLNFPFQATVLSSITSTASGIFASGILTGIHRSTDGGANWTNVLSTGARDIVALTNGTLFARVDENSLFRSTDDGDSWVNVSASLGQGNITSVATDGTRVFAFTSSQKLLESTDDGNSFSIVDGGTPPPLRTSNLRQLAVSANTAIYSSNTEFWRLDLSTAPRTAIAPVVITPPSGKAVNVGAAVTLSVLPSAATQPLTYQWKFEGNNIPGANGPTYTISSATLADAGSYTVEISNAGGSALSAAAILIVEPTTPGSIDYSERRTIPAGASILTYHPLSDGSVIAGGGNTAGGLSDLRKLRADGSVDTSFASPVELAGTTYGVKAGPGDTCYVAGTYGIYRISTVTGEIDFSFNPPQAGSIFSFAVTQDGKITIAGSFTSVNGISRPKIARLHPDGTLDLSFDTSATSTGISGDLAAVAVQQDGKIVAAGGFSSSPAKVIRLLSTGELDPSFTPPLFSTQSNQQVLALTLDGEDRIFLGGSFTLVDNATRNRFIRLNANGTLDTTFPNRPDLLNVTALATQPDGKILVGNPALGSIRLFGVPPLYPSINTITQDTSVAAGQPASFTVTLAGPATGATYEWFKDGTLLPTATAATLAIPSASVADIGRYHVRVTIGTTVLESDSSRLDLLGAPYFVRTPSTATGYLGKPHLLAAQVAGPGPVSYQWFKNDTAISGATGGGLSFAALTAADAATYFVRATAPTGSIDSTPFYLKVLPSRGTVDSSFRFNPASLGFSNSAGSFLSLPNGYHLIGGPFTSTTDGTRSLFRLFPDGTIDPSFNSSPLNVTGVVRWLFRLPNGKIIVGSDVRPIRLNEDLTLDTSFNFPDLNTSIGAIQAMALLSNGGLLVQGFSSTNVPGYPSKFFRTTPSGAIDTTFPAIALVPAASITALSEDSSGRLLIAGSFTQVAGQPRERVARLSAAGVLDATFTGPGIFNNSFSNFIPMKFITQGPDGSVFLGGDGITNIGAAPAGRVVKLHPTTGAHDPTFYPSAFSGTANAIRFLPNGKLALAGNFIAGIQNFSPSYTFYEVLYPNGARDCRELGPVSSNSATSFFPSSPGTDIFLGSFTVPGYSPSSAVRFFTGDVDFGILSQTAITASIPAVPSGTPADTVIVGSNVTLGVSVLGSSTVTYQWYFNGTPIPGATSDTLTRNPVLKTHEGTYFVVATNASGNVSTRQLYLDVRAEPEIVTAPQSVTRPIGSTVNLTVSAVGAGTLSYRWTKAGVDLTDGGAISGSGTATLTITNAQETDSGVYAVRVTNAIDSTTSATAVVNVILQPGSLNTAWTPAAPNGTVQQVLVRADGRVLITAAASGGFTTVGGVGNSRPAVALLNEDGTLNTTFASTQSFPAGFTIRRFVLGPDGLTPYAAVSNGSTSYIFRYGADGLATTLHTVTNGAIYDLAVEAPERITYVGTFSGKVARINIQGSTATADTTFVPPTINDGNVYSIARRTGAGYLLGGSFSTVNSSPYSRVVKLDADGALDTTFTPTNTFTVSTRIFLEELSNGKVLFGGVRYLPTGTSDPTFSASFNPTNWPTTVTDMTRTIDGKLIVVGSFTTVSGQSRRGIVRLTDTGALDPDFTSPSSLTGSLVGVGLGVNGRLYAGGSVTAYNGTAVNRIVRINHEPTDLAFVAQPPSLAANLGTSATFSAQAFGTSAVSYRWLKDGAALADGGRFAGTTTASLTINPVERGDAGAYRLEITNLAGTRLSDPATLTVLAEPMLVASPSGSTLPVGENVSLAASFTGAAPLSYAWTRNGNPVTNGGRFSGATTATLTITGITLDDAGTYVATAGNAFGTEDTEPAVINVVIPPASLDSSIPVSLGANSTVTGLVSLPDGRFLVGGAFTLIGGQSRTYLAVLNANGSVDTSFTPPTMDGTVTRLRGLADGSVIVSGSFTTVAADTVNYRYLYKLTPTLALDTTFRPAINNSANAILEEETGTLLLGGGFTSVGGVTTHPYLARVNATTGAFETSLRAKVNSSVLALLADGSGWTYIGGQFSASGTDTTSGGPAYLARIAGDSTIDTWNPGANNTIYALARDGSGGVLAGGSFTTLSGTTISRSRMARFFADGEIDADFNPAPNSTVRSIAVQDNGSILVSGAFSSIAGTTAPRLARLLPTGAIDPAWEIGSGLGSSSSHYSDPVVIQPDGRIWLMGSFTIYKGTSVSYLVRLNGDPVDLAINRDLPALVVVQPGTTFTLASGATGTSAISYAWTRNDAPVADGGRISGATTSTLEVTGAVVGDSGFYQMTASNAAGSLQTRLAQVIVLDAPVITTQPAGTTVATATNLTLRVEALGAGTVTYQWRRNGTPLENSARIAGATTNTLTITSLLLTDSGDYTVVVSNTLGSATSEVAAITIFAPPAGIDPGFNPAGAASNTVFAVAVEPSGSILIGGAFLGSQARLARILPNGTIDTTYAPVPNAAVTQITPLADGKAIIMGGFSQIAGAARPYLARLNANGTRDTTFNPNTSVLTSHVVLPDGKLMISGGFTAIGSVARAGFARLNADGSLDTTFVPTGTSGTGRAILPLADGGFLLGFSSAPYLIKVGADGTKDTSFTLTASSTVTHLARRADGGVIVAGDFGAFNGVNRAFLAALLPDLSHDSSWGSSVGFNNSISAVAVQPNGKVILGGFFTGNLRRLNADGTSDTSFVAGGFASVGSQPVQAIALEPLGPIWVGGQFTSYAGQTANNLVRLNGDAVNPEPPDSFANWPALANLPIGQRGPNDDPDGDNLDNLLEYALDLNPNGSGGAFTGILPTSQQTPAQLSYTYRRVRNDVTYIVETSPTLIGGTWTSVGVNQGTPAGDGTTTASIPLTPGSAFLRLAVTRNP